MLLTSAKQDQRWVAIAAFLWVGALMFVGVNTLFKRQDARAAIQGSPEYRCLAASTGKQVVVRWSALRNLRDLGTGFTVGTLVEKPGTNCIPDGGAVSFAMLPESTGTSLSAVRIRGREAKAVYRQPGQWADITDATGAERWRNDGAGYRKVSP